MGDLAMGDLAMEILPWETIELVSSLKHVLFRRWKKSKYALAIRDFVLKCLPDFILNLKSAFRELRSAGFDVDSHS